MMLKFAKLHVKTEEMQLSILQVILCVQKPNFIKKIALIVTLCKMDFICIDYLEKKTFTSYLPFSFN